ncbi:MAG: GNAT family N-acetyltransferase [Gemmatimonadetes bacterium]|nr:GNAT family N-acetyltransferase [Gemmatimonadota bacterium]
MPEDRTPGVPPARPGPGGGEFEIELNPPGAEAEFVEKLNLCFDHWGDARTFDWCFRRPAAPAGDLLVARGDHGLVSGAAVTYRTVVLPDGRQLFSGIAMAAWTLPEARGKGVFGRLLAGCVRQAARRGAPVTLSWHTADNVSTRGVQRVGAGMFPTSYAFSGPDTPVPAAGLAVSAVAGEAGWERVRSALEASRVGYTRIGYSPAEWRAQFVDRPLGSELVAVGEVGWAVVERAGEWDRVQALVADTDAGLDACLAALLRRAALSGRRLFVFSSLPSWARRFSRLGLQARPGFLSVMLGDAEGLGRALGVQPEAGAFAHSRLETPGDPWYLGPWNVQSGDRM